MSQTDNKLLSIGVIFGLLWKSILPFTAFVIGGVLLGFGLAMIRTPVFVAKAIVAPYQHRLDQTMGAKVSLGGLGGGLNNLLIGGASNLPPDTQKFLQLLRSVTVSKKLVKDEEFLRRVFPDRWDTKANHWVRPTGLLKKLFQRRENLHPAKPTAWELADFLKRKVDIYALEKTPFYILEFSSSDPKLAVELLERTSSRAEKTLRGHSLELFTEQRDYLFKKLSHTTESEYRDVLWDLLSSVEKRLLLLAPNQPFAVTYLEKPSTPLVPSRPYFMLFLLAGGVIGLTVGTLWSIRSEFDLLHRPPAPDEG